MRPLTTTLILGLCALSLLAAPVAGAETQDQEITCDQAEPCWICDPSLREKGRLWCKEHSRYEDRCWLCHPELKEEGRLYCKEHGVYEDECTLCHPELKAAADAAPAADAAQAKTAPPAVEGPTCAAHGLVEAACFICTPAAREKGRLWCKEHARYEDRCWLCHPELKEEGRLYCEEHGLYEDECPICRPELLREQPDDRKGRAEPPRQRLECKEHAVFEDECAICHPDLAPTLAAGEHLKIRFASETSATKAGVATATPEQVSGTEQFEVYAEIAYDRNHLAHVTPLAGGIVRRVLVDVGQEVTAGEVLVEIASTEVASAKQTYVQALLERRLSEQEHQRQQRLAADRVAAERDVQQAEAAFERAKVAASSAQQALRNLGLDEAAIAAVAERGSTDPLLQVLASFAGTVIDRTVVQGETVDRGADLLQVADLSRMWIELSVPEDHLADLRLGQTVVAQFSALPDHTVTGRLDWISAGVDKRSRMLRARTVVANPQGLLRAGLYGKATVVLGTPRSGLGVPQSSVQRLERQPFVFVRQADDLYVARRVELGPRLGERVLVRSGLSAGEDVVVAGGHVVFSEMYKSKLGAGCVHD